MAQSTTNLGKIHVFPSETLYNQFKDIIADNDLALLKDDGAYIVAALLEQNGYVKFSNGLILQWGYGTWENTQRIITVTLPIPFTNTKYFSTKNVPMLADGHYTEDHEICTFNQTTTTFQFYHQHNAKIGDIYQWFAIGL